MPITVGVGSVIQGNLAFSMIGQSEFALNVLHYQVVSIVGGGGLPAPTAEPVQDVLPAFATSLFTAFKDAWKVLASHHVEMWGAQGKLVWPLPKSATFNYSPTPVAGTQSADALPLQDAATIVKRTGIGSRKGIGRMFVCGFSEDQQEKGILDAATEVQLVALATIVETDLTWTTGLYTYTAVPVLFAVSGGVPDIREVISAELSDAVLKTQRRRRPGKGR